MNHTGEPWYTRESVDEMNIHGEGGSFIASTFGRDNPDKEKADAERIVAAVNFCKGIPTARMADLTGEGVTLLDLVEMFLSPDDIRAFRLALVEEVKREAE